jgi:hypothetical protein
MATRDFFKTSVWLEIAPGMNLQQCKRNLASILQASKLTDISLRNAQMTVSSHFSARRIVWLDEAAPTDFAEISPDHAGHD